AVADTGIDLQFADPEGAFSNAEITGANFKHGAGTLTLKDGVWQCTFAENTPVVLDTIDVHMLGGATASADFTINASDASDDYEVAYYKRGDDGKNTGDPITKDITEVGDYVAVVTAVSGNYEGGKLYVPFSITARQIKSVKIVGSNSVTYNAENHEFQLQFVDSIGATYNVMEGVDYTVEYVRTGNDATAENIQDVNEVGTYRAKITGINDWEGSVELSDLITVKPLDLNASNVKIIGLSSSKDTVEPKNLLAIVIDGKLYSGEDAIISELKAELADSTAVWMKNGSYTYYVSAKNPSEGNIIDTNAFVAHKVSSVLDFTYNGAAWADSYEVIATDSSTHWSNSKVAGQAANGTTSGVKVDGTKMTETIYDANGAKVTRGYMNSVPGTYSVIYEYADADNTVGGVAFTTVTVYQNAVNADASAAVLYDVDGDGKKDIVSSISSTYKPGVNLKDQIEVYVEDEDGNDVTAACTVKYYDANGTEVRAVEDAGTYTLKVTSSDYKLSGTTEMTISIAQLDLSDVNVGALNTVSWDNVGNATEYLPWQKDGVTLDELDLEYKSGDSWVKFPMNQVKATILDAAGNEVKKIEDEGVYTIHFEARNDDAANNFIVPADVTVTCIKDGNNTDGVNHLQFADVEYTDYFANAVSYVANNNFMTGYKGTKLFGSYDNLNRGQMAIVLYNMAKGEGKVDENDLTYTNAGGWMTGFDDVNGNEYYAKAIAWANLAGVVNGYDNGNFGPEDPVTREQFAAMLMNYTKKFGDFEAADTSVLDEYDDASTVSGWAENSVAWGVENGILGNGGFLNAQGEIIRADAACMVYNYTK
ncbi:S-layer homology domain-containing protein, partial [Collinsella ihumii]